MKYTPTNIVHLEANQIMVFGSNTEGRHGKGAALQAMKFGAIYGRSRGRQGQTYAIITKDLSKGYKSIPLSYIEEQLNELAIYAEEHPELEFLLTPIGTGLGGYKVEQIRTILPEFPSNVVLPFVFIEKENE